MVEKANNSDNEEKLTERREDSKAKGGNEIKRPDINLSLRGKQIMEENSENESDNH